MRKLNCESYEEIKRTVVEMLIYYNCLFYPIDPFVIAKVLGIHLHTYAELKERGEELSNNFSKDGFSTWKNEIDLHIFYNDKMPITRIKFTIMHEIGHLVLGHLNLEGELEESEANYFAKYALAPSIMIHAKLEPFVTPKRIQDTFLISYEAATNAFNEYKKWLIVKTNEGYKDYEQKLIKIELVA